MNAYEKQLFQHLVYELNSKNLAFKSALKDSCPALTEHELRVCLYLKSGFSTKEIATVIGISPDSVKKAKHRLRKKLKMKPQDSFNDILNHQVELVR